MRCSVLLGLLGCSACLQPVAYACEDDDQCAKPGAAPGMCEPQGFCSFPDEACDSGRRFSELAAESIAGECVGGEDTTSTTTSTSSTTVDPIPTTTSTTDLSTTTSDDESSTTVALTSGPSSSSSSTGEPEMPEPIGWWAMDDPSPLVVNDQGTGEAHGVLQGEPEWVEGHIGDALELDGIDDRVLIADKPVHDLQEFTMAAWIFVHAASPVAPHPSILGKGQNYRMRLESTSTRLGAVFHDPDATPVNEQGSVTCGDADMLPIDEWHHVASTYGLDDRTLRVFVDGAVVCEITSTGGDGLPDTDDQEIYLGFWNGSGGAWFNGILDDVRLYDVALTEAQVQMLASM